MRNERAKDVPNTSDSGPNLPQMFSVVYDQRKMRAVKTMGINFFRDEIRTGVNEKLEGEELPGRAPSKPQQRTPPSRRGRHSTARPVLRAARS
jgi:hypothetical protein